MSGWTPEGEDLTPEEADIALAGEYVLGLLAEEERRAFEARLGAEPRLRGLVARWSEDMAALLADVPEAAPAAGTEAAILRRLFPGGAAQAARPGLLGRLGLLPLLLGGAVAAALVVVAVNPALVGRGAAPEFEARMAAEDGSLVVMARFDRDTNRLEIEREAGAMPEGRDLELWLIQGEEVRSLGVIPREASGVIEVGAEMAPGMEGGQLALSVEPMGGSPTGVATGPVVAVGPVTEL